MSACVSVAVAVAVVVAVAVAAFAVAAFAVAAFAVAESGEVLPSSALLGTCLAHTIRTPEPANLTRTFSSLPT